MSRTVRETGKGRRWFNKESTENRRAHQRLLRSQERDALATGRYEDAPKPRRTQGWLTH